MFGDKMKDIYDTYDTYNTQLDYIKPIANLKVYIKSDERFIDFFFSIQDLYKFNPQAYEEMIDNLNAFLYLRNQIFVDPLMCNYYYQIADSKKANMLNSLHSIIYNLSNNQLYTNKLTRAHKRLETLLNIEINKMYLRCVYFLKLTGNNVLKRPLETDKVPKAFNNYITKDYTSQFQFY